MSDASRTVSGLVIITKVVPRRASWKIERIGVMLSRGS